MEKEIVVKEKLEDENEVSEDETEEKGSSRETLRTADGEGTDATGAAEGVEEEDDERGSEDYGNYEEDEGEEDVVEDISLEADALQAELEKLVLRFPAMSEPVVAFDLSDFPKSYHENSKREKIFLSYAENFREQYAHLYPNRRPLLLFPVNEFGVEKFVCTTIRPVSLPFGEFYEWSGAAKFVADHLRYVPLSPPYDLPNSLFSPTTLLSLKKGHCFEYATLLASILLGAGYDAYVVSGYAVREVCTMDESRDLCPLLLPETEIPPPKPEVPSKKYIVRQPKDLVSKYEAWMESRRLKVIADEAAKKQKEEDDKRLLAELPPADPLRGWRIHAWVLVLDGKREIGTPFFLEPLTGIAHPTVSPLFLGIESIWNQFNYWVNMQNCSEGLGSLVYDLQDWTLWEYLIPTNEKVTINVKVDNEEDVGCTEEVKEKDDDIQKHLDLPPPWVRAVCLSHKDFEQRYPSGTQVTIYKRAKVEDYAPYLLPDGLIRRILIYEDLLMTKLVQVKEYYANRADKLTLKVFDFITTWISRHYACGRPRHLKEYHCKAIGKVQHAERTMVFYHKARFDCLESRVETPMDMTEHYVARDDFLNYCYVKYIGAPLKYGHIDTTPRPADKIIVRYDRNPSKPANEDVKEIIFNISENRDDVTYHHEDDKITSSTREFIKPTGDAIKGTVVLWNVDNHSTYQVVATRKQKRRYEIYQMMLDLLHSEEACLDHVLESQRDVKNLLDELRAEEVECALEVAVYDVGRNDKAQKHRKQLERQKMEEEMAKQEVEPDFLSPFITQIVFDEQSPPAEDSSTALVIDNELRSSSSTTTGKRSGRRVTIVTSSEFSFTRQRVHLLRQLCLADFKQRMIDIANLIQAKFEKESDDLKRKQVWYQQNQVSLQKEDEREYLAYCCETTFRIRVLEARLQRHKDTASSRYLAMDQRIRSDPRMAAFF